jgi:hypothetical protein
LMTSPQVVGRADCVAHGTWSGDALHSSVPGASTYRIACAVPQILI